MAAAETRTILYNEDTTDASSLRIVAMRLWFSRSSDLSIRDQLVTQVVLGIVSGDLAPGQRLPSTRELARRFHLHPNTVSSSYRQLERNHWVDLRKGSGIYVREQKPEAPLHSAVALDCLISDFLQSARKLDLPLSVIHLRVRQWLELQPPDHFLLIEPDKELASILLAEMRKAVSFPVKTCGLEECTSGALLAGALPVALSMMTKVVRDLLPQRSELLSLQLRSASDSLASHLPARSNALIGISSRWPLFLKTARTMLIAAGFHPDSLVLRDASKPNWRRGLKQAAAVVCDSLTGPSLDGSCRVLVFPLIADFSVKALREFEQFIRTPIAP
jgi:DNA-binding transcriptional regulator YhcF (GntR family)